jgi:N-acetylglucosaminyldiphosphoundecaprenol N-acetyl-beta-D-mannosaminyltransferase
MPKEINPVVIPAKAGIYILNVRFDNVTSEQAITKVQDFLKDNKQHQIVTANPEFLLEAKKNEKFKNVLNNADLCLPDGIGILWAAKLINVIETKIIKSKFLISCYAILGLFALVFYPKYNRSVIKERVTGVDILEKICKSSNGSSIFFLGAKEGIAKKTAEILNNKYPNFKIAGTYCGSPTLKDKNIIEQKINTTKPDILFAAFSFPTQDIWISENLHKFPSVKIAMGIGGSFDYISGNIKRAPKWMQKLGIEWLYRLIKEPKKRFKRIYNALIKFPIAIVKDLANY